MGSLTRHFRRHTGEQREKKYVCPTCGKRYNNFDVQNKIVLNCY